MSKSIKTHYEKNSFIALLSSMTPGELADYLRVNGKVKRINPFIKLEKSFSQEDQNHGYNKQQQ